MSDFVVLIPARLSSSRLPNKALADIHGKPMVVRVAERACLSKASKVVVATDHADIQAACQAHGIEAVLTATDHESGTTRLAEAASILNLAENDCVVNVQGDEPLIEPELINAVAAQLQQSCAPMATAAHLLTEYADFIDANCVKVVLNSQHNALYFSRAAIPWPRELMRSGAEMMPKDIPVYRHIGIYGYRVQFLHQYSDLTPSPLEQAESLEQLRVLWHGFNIAVQITSHAPAAGVDTMADLERVRTSWPDIHK
ncbi:3-deoxy-manno-octulosonate cytidylyltransferase [Snodgrassella alvi]|jgi:3-deoxy-manno-octulosonate cytidylyltransferase (CMP-KDO synthetase)|uniref:3-deoxy-manno-octulosonate cytidylyltransferase n=1 Tax=Snodgrassella alvi TaxID=1196083 RepID=A0A2N9XYZ0_9NEIS|nr:3-deoxy-manno-octulosonate cytidylyltransferase [Snodgrassella alvi]PIT56139.1 3-deoxy-manno-octulosonate cytidylyltransferase [Snodgrassella alvi]